MFWYKLLGYTIKDLNIVKIQEITEELVSKLHYQCYLFDANKKY
jgi:hypothetical protein